MKAWLARVDTLWLRLFALLWVALVASHLVAYAIVHEWGMPGPPNGPGHPSDPGRPGEPAAWPGLPPLPSLPPGSLFDGRPAPPGSGGGVSSLPPRTAPADPNAGDGAGRVGGVAPSSLWLDYVIRFAVIALFAALGASWLARPMRRLTAGSRTLEQSLGRPGPAPQIDAARGPVEVRACAAVFNGMSQRLHAQFQSRTLFMAAISHDLRTPLARLRLRLEVLRQGASDSRPREIDAGIADLHEMDALIEAVLAALRDERAAEPPQAIDLPALLQALADDAAEQGQPVCFRHDSDAPVVVHTQLLALKRLIGNLLSNALRHAGQARLQLYAEPTQLRITIDDDGPGIPEDALASVFEPFFRLDSARSRGPAGGVGLGLYIARGLAQRLGGTLQLSNRREGGLRATLSLPH